MTLSAVTDSQTQTLNARQTHSLKHTGTVSVLTLHFQKKNTKKSTVFIKSTAPTWSLELTARSAPWANRQVFLLETSIIFSTYYFFSDSCNCIVTKSAFPHKLSVILGAFLLRAHTQLSPKSLRNRSINIYNRGIVAGSQHFVSLRAPCCSETTWKPQFVMLQIQNIPLNSTDQARSKVDLNEVPLSVIQQCLCHLKCLV